MTSIPTTGLPAAFDSFTVVAAYELAWSGPADAPLSVEYVTPGDLAVAQAEDQGTLEIADPGLVLLTLQDGQAVPVGDQTLTITDDASSVAGALLPDAQLTVAQDGTSDDRNGGFLIVTDLNEVFRIRQIDFPAAALVTLGFSQPLRVAVLNLSPAKPLTDVSVIAWTSLGQEHLLPRGVPGELPDLLKRPQWIEPDIPPNGAAGVLERLRDKVCADAGLVTYTWVAVGRALLAPDGEFAEFVRGFSVRRELSFVCGPPRISLEVTYSGFELDTHFYAFELDSPGGTPVPEADYSFETIPSFTRIGCGTAVSPVGFSFAGFNFDSPAITFGYLYKGCLGRRCGGGNQDRGPLRLHAHRPRLPHPLHILSTRRRPSNSSAKAGDASAARASVTGTATPSPLPSNTARGRGARDGSTGRSRCTRTILVTDGAGIYEFPFEGLSSASSERLMRHMAQCL